MDRKDYFNNAQCDYSVSNVIFNLNFVEFNLTAGWRQQAIFEHCAAQCTSFNLLIIFV